MKKEEWLAVFRQEPKKVAAEVQRVYRLHVAGPLDGDGLGRFYRPLHDRQKQLEDEIPRLQAEADLLKIDHLSTDQILAGARDLHNRWLHLDRGERHRIIERASPKRLSWGRMRST